MLPGEAAWDYIARLQGRENFESEVATLSDEVKVLQALVSSLAQTMVGAGVVDGAKLGDNFQSALETIFPKPQPVGPPPAPTMPDIPALYRDKQRPQISSAPPSEPTVACARCSKQVLHSKTNITGSGLFCDDCYAASPMP